MKVIITGATGYVGEGVLLACLDNAEITQVLSVSRRSCGHSHPKLKEMLVQDFMAIEPGDSALQGYDAVFFCMGISSVGTDMETYRRVCHDMPILFAQCVGPRENMTFIYMSGMGTDETEKSRLEWARIKGNTENTIAGMGFKGSFGFRPSLMRAYPGQTARKGMIITEKILYPLMRPLGQANTIDEVAKAMIACTKGLSSRSLVFPKDIKHLARL